MSAWDDINKEEGTEAALATRPGHESRDAAIDDGFGEAVHQAGDGDGSAEGHDAHAEVEFEDAEPAKKKGPNPKVILAIFGLVVAGVIGIFGWKVSSVMMARKGGAATKLAAAAPEPADTMPVGIARGPGTTVLGSETPARASTPADIVGGVAASVEQAQATASSAPAVTAATPPTASMAVTSATTTQAVAPSTPTVAGPPAAAAPVASVVAQAPRRAGDEPSPSISEVQDLRKQVAALRAELDRVAARSAAPAATRATVEHGTQKPAAHKVVRTEARGLPVHAARHESGRGADDAGPAARAPREVMLGTEVIQSAAVLPGMKLRGVYPPTGDDRQAWVLLGDAVQIVSKGAVIGGATVLKIESDRIVTDRGLIR